MRKRPWLVAAATAATAAGLAVAQLGEHIFAVARWSWG
jgi:hypothetical protein